MSGRIVYNPDYYLWHAKVTSDGASFNCAFDILPAGARFLDAGSREFCEQVISALDIRTDRIADWSLTRFCSAYYADRPTDDDWRKRFQLAWHMSVQGTGQPSRTGYLGVGPFPAVANDPTWRPSSADWNLVTEDCEVLADRVAPADSLGKVRPPDEPARRLDSYDATFQDFPIPSGVLRHSRIILGRLELEEEHARIDEVLVVCEQEGLLTHCRRTLLRIADLSDEAGVVR